MGRFGTTKRESLRHIYGTPYFRQAKRIDNNTYRYFDGENTHIRLHRTNIVTLRMASVTFNTDGWRTVTTKDRLNKFCPHGFGFWSQKGVWYVSTPAGTKYWFEDGIQFDYEGNCLSGHAMYHERRKKDDFMPVDEEVRRMIMAYVHKVKDFGPTLPTPEPGDCWLCMGEHRTSPDVKMDNSHLLSHLIEGYIHGSIIRNAVDSRNEGGQRYAYSLRRDPENEGRFILPNGDLVRRDLLWYLKRRLLGRVQPNELNSLKQIHRDLSEPPEALLATVATEE